MIMMPIFLFVPVLICALHSGTIHAVWRKPEKKFSDHKKP